MATLRGAVDVVRREVRDAAAAAPSDTRQSPKPGVALAAASSFATKLAAASAICASLDAISAARGSKRLTKRIAVKLDALLPPEAPRTVHFGEGTKVA